MDLRLNSPPAVADPVEGIEAIAPICWSDKIDLFHQFSANYTVN